MTDVAGTRAGTATVLFTDLVASTHSRQVLGDERADDLRRAHDRVLREAIAAHGGTEVKGTGDGMMVAFAAAAEAVSAAVSMQRGMHRLSRRSPVPVAIRVGISAGDVSWEGSDCFGTPVVEASRLCDAADAGVILASEVVRLLAGSRGSHVFRSVGELSLKGLDDAMPAVEVEWEVQTEGFVPLPAALAGPHIVDFVGRAAELDAIHGAWKRAGDGAARFVVVSGEPGVGKTRFVSELARRAHDDGAVVLFGRCDEDLAVPYQPFVEALSTYVAAAPVDDLAEQVGAYGGDLTRLVPTIAERVPSLPDPLRADPDAERYRLFESVAAFLAAIAVDAPVLVVLDDLHWGGKPELLLVRHLLRTAAGARILLVGTYRDTDLDRRHPLAEVLGDLRRDDALERISLTGLDEGEVNEFLASAAGQRLGTGADALAREVHAETEGNPFFVGQVLRHLVESGAVVERDGEWVRSRSAAAVGIPEGIREVIGRRLATLSAATNELLAVAAVVGREFALDVVRDAAGVDGDAMLDALEEAEAAHLIEGVPDAPKRRSFVHALLRSTLYDEIPTTRRLRLHRRVAKAFEAAATGPDQHVADLARHYCECAALDETDSAVRWSRAAAAQAMDRLAYEEAAGFYERALSVLEPDVPTDRQARAELLVELGRTHWATGGREACRSVLHEGAALARELGDAQLFARAAVVAGGKRGWSDAGVVDEGLVALLEEALTLLPPADSELRAMCGARLASELYFFADLSERRQQLTAESLAMARRVGDPETLGHVLSCAHWGTWTPGGADERLLIAREMLELASVSADRELEMAARLWVFGDLMELGRTAEAIEILDRELALADELRQPEYLWGAHVHKACIHLMRGEHDEAMRVAGAALTWGQAMQSETALQMYGIAQLNQTRAKGGDEALVPLVAAMVERYPLIPAWRTGLALLYRQMERDDDLKAQVEVLAPDRFAALPRDANWTPGMSVMAVSCAYLGDVERCRVIYDLMQPFAPYAVNVGLPADCLGPVELYLAVLAVVLGEDDLAEEHFQRGLAQADTMGCATAAAVLIHEYASAWARRGGPEARERAAQLAVEVTRRAERLDMPRLVEMAEKLR